MDTCLFFGKGAMMFVASFLLYICRLDAAPIPPPLSFFFLKKKKPVNDDSWCLNYMMHRLRAGRTFFAWRGMDGVEGNVMEHTGVSKIIRFMQSQRMPAALRDFLPSAEGKDSRGCLPISAAGGVMRLSVAERVQSACRCMVCSGQACS